MREMFDMSVYTRGSATHFLTNGTSHSPELGGTASVINGNLIRFQHYTFNGPITTGLICRPSERCKLITEIALALRYINLYLIDYL